MGHQFVALISRLIKFFLFNCEVTFGNKFLIIASIPLFFDLQSGSSENISDSVGKSFVLAIDIIFFEVG